MRDMEKRCGWRQPPAIDFLRAGISRAPSLVTRRQMDHFRPPPRKIQPDLPDRLRRPQHALAHVGYFPGRCAELVARWKECLLRLKPYPKLAGVEEGSRNRTRIAGNPTRRLCGL